MKQPLVIGYKGEIGFFILGGLLKLMPKALDVWCVDTNETKEEAEQRIKVSDTLFLCIPLEATAEWLIRHKELLKGKTIIEQCSLKEWLFEVPELKDLGIRSMHILFRPSQTPNLNDRTVGLFEGQFDAELTDNIAFITQSKIKWFKNAEQHDREMAVAQGALHRTLLILEKMLRECNGSTFISKRVTELAERIRKGNKDLYQMIQQNKYLPEVIAKMQKDLLEFNINDFWQRGGVGERLKPTVPKTVTLNGVGSSNLSASANLLKGKQ